MGSETPSGSGGFGQGGRESASGLFFDSRDYDLLRIVRDILRRKSLDHKRLFGPFPHPHGIREMAAPQALRIAYAMAHLLGSLEIGAASDRLAALQSLRDEVFSSSQSGMRINTARVLLEIMKHLIRTGEDGPSRLMLAHDFNAAAVGRPRAIREQLARYHLLEMPEEWNQVTFDDHVHDANTKGRKTPTHLIMDAWIKGIRRLTVVYPNHVPKEAARELLEAGKIMGIKIRIGFEHFTTFRSKTVQLLCAPRGISDAKSFGAFLSKPAVEAFMEEGRRKALRHQAFLLEKLAWFNATVRPELDRTLGISLEPLDPDAFLAFVGTGQASLQHLGKFIHEQTVPLLQGRLAVLRKRYAEASPEERVRIRELVAGMDALTPQRIIEAYLRNAVVPAEIQYPVRPTTPAELAQRVAGLHPRSRIILNLCRLGVEDVLEILYDCKGLVTHLEIVNLKNVAQGRDIDHEAILELQGAINSGSIIALKKCVSGIVTRVGDRYGEERQQKLLAILCDLQTLQSAYAKKPLQSCIGSDSTGQSGQTHGMGFALIDSLPARARKQLRPQEAVPVRVEAFARHTVMPDKIRGAATGWLGAACRCLPGLASLGCARKTDWVLRDYRPVEPAEGNIYTLGGERQPESNGLVLEEAGPARNARSIPWRYLKTSILISVKILLGFIPAFITFVLTSDWWLLAYGGAVIWFAITGLRNVIQSVLGCGGVHRSSLIRWGSLVSWNRIADSLFYSGLSVPLLEFGVKIWLMETVCGITVANNPFLLYAAISVVNGFYLLAHNLFRGLPKAAAYGNLFRSVVNIPVSMGLSSLTGGVLLLCGIPPEAIDGLLQKWAAVLSKLASDAIAGIIEGIADKHLYLRIRSLDYAGKMKQLVDTCNQLELAFPLESVLSLMESPDRLLRAVERERRDLLNILIVHVLDLLYFWMYQPRAREVLRSRLLLLSQDERRMFVASQKVLSLERQVAQVFVDGLVGKRFSRALAFYLHHWRGYLKDIEATGS